MQSLSDSPRTASVPSHFQLLQKDLLAGGERTKQAAQSILSEGGQTTRTHADELIRLLDQDSPLSGSIALALGRLGDTQAVEPLIQLLEHKPHDVRAFAAWGLGLLRDQRALEALMRRMEDKTKENVIVRNYATWAFGELVSTLREQGDSRRVEQLVQHLLQRLEDKDERYKIRKSAAKALAKINTDDARRGLGASEYKNMLPPD